MLFASKRTELRSPVSERVSTGLVVRGEKRGEEKRREEKRGEEKRGEDKKRGERRGEERRRQEKEQTIRQARTVEYIKQ